jgi:hypothetical protein
MPLDVRLTFPTYHKGPKPRQLRMCRSFLFINTANSYFAIQDEVMGTSKNSDLREFVRV